MRGGGTCEGCRRWRLLGDRLVSCGGWSLWVVQFVRDVMALE